MTIEVLRVESHDAERLFELRRQALLEEPFAFLSSPEDDAASSPEAVQHKLTSETDSSVVIGAFDGYKLIGMAGLARNRLIKTAHRACIWGVFVRQEYRRIGVGSQLLAVALDYARQMEGVVSVYLSVSEKAVAAKQMYESAGFVVWGVEPDCIRYQGESAREYHLAMEL